MDTSECGGVVFQDTLVTSDPRGSQSPLDHVSYVCMYESGDRKCLQTYAAAVSVYPGSGKM